jgi:anti-anti-sigma factor
VPVSGGEHVDARLEDVQVERPQSGAAVVSFTGEHDLATAPAVEALLGSLIEQNELVVVDFSEAEFVDSSMIHTLVKADREARKRGGSFRLQLGTAPIVRKAFELCGLFEQLDLAPSWEHALRNGSSGT